MGVILQKRGYWTGGRWRTSWLVSADVDEDGSVSIISGDLKREWHVTVRSDSLQSLLAALASPRTIARDAEGLADLQQRVLVALHHRFANDEQEGVLEKVASFLDVHAISYERAFW
jgi:hypothetical protein